MRSRAPLKLTHTTPLPELRDGDFDHFLADVKGNRLFATAEENSKVLVFDLKTNKLLSTRSMTSRRRTRCYIAPT